MSGLPPVAVKPPDIGRLVVSVTYDPIQRRNQVEILRADPRALLDDETMHQLSRPDLWTDPPIVESDRTTSLTIHATNGSVTYRLLEVQEYPRRWLIEWPD